MSNGHLTAANIFSCSGLVAVITGGGSGIGLMVARALDANGAKAVYILGRRQETLEAAAKQAINGTLIPVQCDVAEQSSLSAAAARIREEQGEVHVLFANAGKSGPSPNKNLPKDRAPTIQEISDANLALPMDDFTRTLSLNVTSVLYTCMTFLPLLDAANVNAAKRDGGVPRQSSSIVVTASLAAFNRSPTTGFAYGTSKAAAVHLVKQLSTYLGPHKIRVNALAPGVYPSEMTARSGYMGMSSEGSMTEPTKVPAEVCPLERTGGEEDMAGAALFLMSRGGAYIDGMVLLTDGGRLGLYPATY